MQSITKSVRTFNELCDRLLSVIADCLKASFKNGSVRLRYLSICRQYYHNNRIYKHKGSTTVCLSQINDIIQTIITPPNN
jgi:hypothetical protein